MVTKKEKMLLTEMKECAETLKRLIAMKSDIRTVQTIQLRLQRIYNEQSHFIRSDGRSGNGSICENCDQMWVDHIAPNSTCPTVKEDDSTDDDKTDWLIE